MSDLEPQPKKYVRKKKYKSKRTGVEKIIIDVVLPVDTYKRLKEIANMLYPDLSRGQISYTLKEIIDFYYTVHAQKPTRNINPRGTTREAFRAVLRELERQFNFIPNQVRNYELWDTIMIALDVRDPRTIRKWILRFMTEGLIKLLTQNIENIERVKRNWKIVWEIVAVKV